jgi:hypothetical protein
MGQGFGPLDTARIVALQRLAGNAAVTALLTSVQRDTEWPDAKTMNKKRDVRGGEVIRYPIYPLSVGNQSKNKHGSAVEAADKRAIVLVPAKLKPAKEVDILFHLHGHYIGWREATQDDGDMGAVKGQVRDEGEEGIVDGLPPDMIAILPQGTTDSEFGDLDVTSYAEAALKMVPKWEGAKPRRVVFSAHSGGGGVLNPKLGPENSAKFTKPKKDETKKQKEARELAAEKAAKKFDDDWQKRQAHPPATLPTGLREVTLFDAINGPHELSHATVWVTDNIKADLAALENKPESEQYKYLKDRVRFRAYYSNGSYVRRHEALRGSIDDLLGPTTKSPKISQAVWNVLADLYKVTGPIEIGHNLIVRTKLEEALKAR